MQYTGLRADTDTQQFPAPGGPLPPALNRVAPSDPNAGSGHKPKRRLSAETRAKIQQAARARYEWDDAKTERVKALVLSGASSREIARLERVYRGTLAKFCQEHGLSRPTRRNFTAEGDAVLLRGYATNPDLAALLREYQAARGYEASYDAMRQNATRLGLHRPRVFPMAPRANSRADRAAEYAEAREAIAPELQAYLNAGMGLLAACKRMKISVKRAYRMEQDGLLTRPEAPPKPPPVERAPRAPKPVRVAVQKPKKLPASWVRAAAPPPKPKRVYETVEAFLAAGGRITHCPAAAVAATTAAMGEGREVIRRHAALMAGDDGNWVARSKKKMGRFHFGAQAS